MYMYSFSVCRVLVLSRWSCNVFCWGNHLSAGFADMLRQIIRKRLGVIKPYHLLANYTRRICKLLDEDKSAGGENENRARDSSKQCKTDKTIKNFSETPQRFRKLSKSSVVALAFRIRLKT